MSICGLPHARTCCCGWLVDVDRRYLLAGQTHASMLWCMSNASARVVMCGSFCVVVHVRVRKQPIYLSDAEFPYATIGELGLGIETVRGREFVTESPTNPTNANFIPLCNGREEPQRENEIFSRLPFLERRRKRISLVLRR